MKRSGIQKVVSFLLTAAMLFSLSSGVFAAQPLKESSRAAISYAGSLGTVGSEDLPGTGAETGNNVAAAAQAVAVLLQNVDTSLADLSSYQITESELVEIFEMLIPTVYPELMDFEKYYYSTGRGDGLVKYLRVEYGASKEVIQARLTQLKQAEKAVLERIDPNLGTLEKIKTVHDYLAETVSYDVKSALSGSTGKRSIFTATGALVEKKAVCQGYALAFQMLMNDLKIDCMFVSSNEMDHAWNLVEYKNDWYHVDATWDDPVPDVPGAVGHMTFMVSDSRIGDSENRHYGWKSYLPEADNTQFDSYDWTKVPVPSIVSSPISLDTAAYAGTAGGVYQFLVKGAAGQQLTVTGSDPDVVSVLPETRTDSRGTIYTVRLLAAGSATVLVTTPAGGMASVSFSVSQAAKAA